MTHSRLNSNMPVKCIILAAAIIGTLQAATWFSLSLVSILYHESVIEVGDLEEASYGQYIYNLYLRPNDGNGEFIIYPKTFNLFMYIYLVLSFIWLIASCILMWAAIRDKWKSIPLLLAFWATVTIVIAITDIILMSLIAADLQTAHNKYNPTTTTLIPIPSTTTTPITTTLSSTTITTLFPTSDSTSTTTTATPNDDTDDTGVLSLRMPRRYQEYEIDEFQYQSQTLYTSMGIVMSIAARGYILWIVNVTFAIMLFILVKKIKRANRPSMLPAIDAYAAGPRPFTLYDQTDIGNGQLNNGFTLDENIMFNPRPMEPNTRMSTRNPLSNNRNNLNVMQPQIHDRPRSLDLSRLTRGVPPTPPSKLAKIGKSGGRITPPRNVPSPRVPYIPDPDYTPPGSPKVQPKSAMRQQSNYVL
ncbi:hypothetical protein JTB14_013683 [Gonioctena quinquepunctata]|nr:hypothetical protein JTB14_013683 [Gonioctena quinquepunctata]